MTKMMLRPFYPGATRENAIGKTNLARACCAVCDICGKSRNKGNHQKCSKQRQAENAKKYKEQ